MTSKADDKTVNITIIGGFLGSGKTTLLQQLLKNLPGGQRSAVIINDFGEINIDGLLIEKGDYSKKEIAGGCVCCTLKEKLLLVIDQIIREEAPDTILIEATGLAAPWEMKQTIERGLPELSFDIKDVLVCVDVKQESRFHDRLPAYSKQFEGKPSILFTKIDVYEESLIQSCQEKLSRHYPKIENYNSCSQGVIHSRTKVAPKLQVVAANSVLAGLFDTPLLFPGDKSGLVDSTFQAELVPNVTKDEIIGLIQEEGQKIVRLKALINQNGLWLIHFDGETLELKKIESKKELEHLSILTYFCFEKDQKGLDESFQKFFSKKI